MPPVPRQDAPLRMPLSASAASTLETAAKGGKGRGMSRPQTAGEVPFGTSPVTSCGQPRSFPCADVFQRPFELRVYAAAHLGLDLGGLKHLDMGDDAYALVYLAPGIFHHGRRTVYAHY